MANVWLYIPHSGSTIGCTSSSVLSAAEGLFNSGQKLCFSEQGFGCLTHNFNMGWAACYNAHKTEGITHFAMLHSDIGTEQHVLNKMIDLMDKHGADVLSVAMALGDFRGLSSTGVLGTSGPEEREARLTFKEIYQLPETFSVNDLNEPGHILVINTGLWIMRFDPELWRKFGGFQIENTMFYETETDTMKATFYSEDWLFSEWAAAMGLKVMCTRAVGAYHLKPHRFENTHPWGSQQYDYEFVQLPASGENGHLGGSTRPTKVTPNGDDASWCPPVWDDLIVHEGVKTVLDVGSGCGFAARYFEKQGCDVLGIEADPQALACYQGSKYLKHDFTRGPAAIHEDYDLAWCCEVAEHIDSKYEGFFLDALAHAKVIAMTHATPGQTGTHHVNCQEADYWIDRIEKLGYWYDAGTTASLKRLVNHGSEMGHHFAQRGLLFRRVTANGN